MQEFFLVHETPLKNLSKIIRYGYLYTQISRKKLRETTITGEGGENRKLCHPLTTLTAIVENNCDEAVGVYFRVYPTREMIGQPKRGKAQIILRGDILQHYEWHVNYCENNGFFIREGDINYFGVETKECFPSSMKEIELEKIDVEDSEIVVYSDVNILLDGGKYLEEIRTKKMDEKTKKYVEKHNVWMKYFVESVLKKSFSKRGTPTTQKRRRSYSYSTNKTMRTRQTRRTL